MEFLNNETFQTFFLFFLVILSIAGETENMPSFRGIPALHQFLILWIVMPILLGLTLIPVKYTYDVVLGTFGFHTGVSFLQIAAVSYLFSIIRSTIQLAVTYGVREANAKE